MGKRVWQNDEWQNDLRRGFGGKENPSVGFRSFLWRERGWGIEWGGGTRPYREGGPFRGFKSSSRPVLGKHGRFCTFKSSTRSSKAVHGAVQEERGGTTTNGHEFTRMGVATLSANKCG